jgi:carbonic anhydrase
MAGTWEPFGSTRASAGTAGAGVPREPAKQLAVLTCMDVRIDPLPVLGLKLGDANVLRNAGAIVTDDVLRSLRAAASLLGVRRAVLLGHTDCAGHGGDAAAAAAALSDGARRLRDEGFEVETLMYDVVSGAVTPVS